MDPRLPFTPAAGKGARKPLRGESIVSLAGSPLGSFAAAPGLRATLGGCPAAATDTAEEESVTESVNTVAMAVGNQVLDLSDPATQDKLKGEERKNAVEQLQSRQSQRSDLLAKFQK